MENRPASPLEFFSPLTVFVICEVGLLFALGAVMVFGTSSAILLDRIDFANTHQALVRQLFYAVVGALLGLSVFFVGYRVLLQRAPLFLGLVTLGLALCYLPGTRRPYNGAHRWVGVAGISFQPSEFAKFTLPAVLIYYLSGLHRPKVDMSLEQRFSRGCLAILPALVLIWLAPDNRTTLLVLSSCALVFALTLVPLRLWLLPLLAFLLIGGAIALQLPYVQNRLKAYVDPGGDLRGRGHQPHQAKIAAGSGGLWGVGLGRSLQKYHYLPEAQNDYIAAIFAEELGFAGIFTLICLYASLTLASWRLSMRCEETAGQILGLVLTYSLSIQSFINLGVVSGLLPATGLNLPFFSQGGTSLWANLTSIALLLSIGEQRSAATRGERA